MAYLPTDLGATLKVLGQEAEERSAEIDAARCLPDDLMKKVKESGTIRLWAAKAYGGSQAHIFSLIEAIESLAYYNGSLGWVVCVTGTAALGSGYLQPESAQEIFGDVYSQTGGWAAPAGRAKKVGGGYRVSGKWAWGSGISHCSHIVGGVLIMPEREGKPVSALAFFDPKEVSFIDNWKVLGLKGSNSIDYTVKDAFVPDNHLIPFPVQTPVIDDTLYRFSFLGALAAGVASVGVGLAQRAIDEITLLSKTKKPNGAARTLSDRPIVHDKIARLMAQHRSAKLFLRDAIEKNWAEAEQKDTHTSTKSELRLAASYAVAESAKVIEEAYRMGGGSTVWDGVKLQELLRDVNMLTQHGLVSPNMFEIAGRVSFDLPVNKWLL